MITMTVRVEGLDALREGFRRAPNLTLKYLAAATKAAINEIDKQVDEGGIMQYRTPRSKRSGLLVSTWGLEKSFSRGGLQGITGPTREYAWNVWKGQRSDSKRGRTIYWGPNDYMGRIADKATPGVEKHFEQAVDIIVSKIINT